MKKILCFLFVATTGAPLFAQNGFTENKGQLHDQHGNPRTDILYFGNSGNLAYYLGNTGLSYQLYRTDTWTENYTSGKIVIPRYPSQSTLYRVDVRWKNARPVTAIQTDAPFDSYTNYYNNAFPEGLLNVRTYKGVSYSNIYNKIDLHYYMKNDQLKYDFIIHPGGEVKSIQYEINGADKLSVDKNGALVIETPLGKILEDAPIAYQGDVIITSEWKVRGNTVYFEMGKYDLSKKLIIDPQTRIWATYYGDPSFTQFYSSAIDASGNLYACGITDDLTSIATVGAHQTTHGGGSPYGDAFIVKLNAAGVRQWATYYGGTGQDDAQACVVDLSGNVYIAGGTKSASAIASVGSHQATTNTSPSGWSDGFLAKFNTSGVRQWATYYGGNSIDVTTSCALDASGNIFIGGHTNSTNATSGTAIATAGSHKATLTSGTDGFLAKFNSSGIRQWGTYYGGNGTDQIYGCSVDATGNLFFCGQTYNSSSGIATAGAHQTSDGGMEDGFFGKMNTSGVVQWGTYFGDGVVDNAWAIANDPSGNVYIAGATGSGFAIATVGAHQTMNNGGGMDCYLTKFSTTGTQLWGTYYGGTGGEWQYSIGCTTDAAGNVYLTGSSDSPSPSNEISTSAGYQPALNASTLRDAFLAKFNSSGVRQWGTYYGDSNVEFGYNCEIDGSGNVYMVGYTQSSGTILATAGAHQTSCGGICGIVVKFNGVTGFQEDLNASEEISVFPNPAGDVLQVAFGKTVSSVKVQILNISGQVIHEHPVSNANTMLLNTEGIANGVYYLRINFEDTQTVIKFIKQ